MNVLLLTKKAPVKDLQKKGSIQMHATKIVHYDGE